jgi:hypothetical protein
MGAWISRFLSRSVRTAIIVLLIAVTSLVACKTNPATPQPSDKSATRAQPSATVQATAGLSGVDLTVWSTHDKAPAKGKVTYRVYYANLSLDRPAQDVVLQIHPPEGANLLKVNRDRRRWPGEMGLR